MNKPRGQRPQPPESQSSDAREPGAAVQLRQLTLRAGSRTLLRQVTAHFAAGQVTLIVGSSGAGKSLLLRTLAGLIATQQDIHADGEVFIDRRPVTSRSAGASKRQAAPRVGVVFQSFALFDELTPLENVRLAAAHRRDLAAQPALEPERLLDELRVPRDVPTGALSGGQRQRLAIARTLAYDPDVVLYDEPTSGLDPATATQVASLIRGTHAAHPKTSIIVTHDYAALAPIADRIYLLDSHEQTLREVERTRWPELPLLLEAAARTAPAALRDESSSSSLASQPLRGRPWIAALARSAGRALESTTRAAEQLLATLVQLIPLWPSPKWGLRYLWHYLLLVAGPSAWLYLTLAGVIVGFVTTYFTFRFLPYRTYTEPLLIENLLQSMGFALFRILVPVLATILIAARCGAAAASDIGGKAYGQQIDALRTFGVRPARYLHTGVLYAMLLGTPWLTALCYASATLTSLVVFTATHPDQGPEFWRLYYHRQLSVPEQVLYQGSGWWLAKVLLCAAGIATLAYRIGCQEKHSSRDVSQAITATILWSTLLVLLVHFVFAFFEFE